MANQEHVLLARQGTLAISRWQQQHPGEALDFRGANLSDHNLNKADLREADFGGADLIGLRLNQATLIGANFKGAVLLMGYLSGADLRGADLSDATLRNADLTASNLTGASLDKAYLKGANLSGSNLVNAVLRGADFSEAVLNGADLKGADLSKADFSGADLTRADLTETNLCKVSFYRTTLSDTSFRGAVMFHTVFGDCDLSKAGHLDEVIHAGPSAVATDTLVRSAGQVPHNFFRGTGVPEDVIIKYGNGDTESPNRLFHCFISCSIKDQEFTERLQADLEASGVRCWYFPADYGAGQWMAEATRSEGPSYWSSEDIDRGIPYYDKLVVVCSEDSLAAERVRDEIIHGVQRQDETGRWLFYPVAISDAPFDGKNRYVRMLKLSRHLFVDFRGWDDSRAYKAALDKLIGYLNRDDDSSVGMVPEKDEGR